MWVIDKVGWEVKKPLKKSSDFWMEAEQHEENITRRYRNPKSSPGLQFNVSSIGHFKEYQDNMNLGAH